MISNRPAIAQRRMLLEQTVAAVFNARSQWTNLKVVYGGPSFTGEKEFLLSKGINEEHLKEVDPAQLKNELKDECPQIVLIHLPLEAFDSSYPKLFDLVHHIKALKSNGPRILIVECDAPGMKDQVLYRDNPRSVRQIYLDLLKTIEEKLDEKAFVAFHEELIAEVSDDPEKRLSWICSHTEGKKWLKEEACQKLFAEAAIAILRENHASKTFESTCIAGDEKELDQLSQWVGPKKKYSDLVKKIDKDSNEYLLFNTLPGDDLLESSADLLRIPGVWSLLEERSGKQFDLLCGKSFNQMPDSKKFSITGESRFETSDDESESESKSIPDINSSFRKFELDSSPLSSLMNTGMGPNPLATPKPSPIQKKKTISLEGYGETYLAMLSSAIRKKVYIGGALFEYGLKGFDSRQILASVVVLNEDADLYKHVEAFAKALGLPQPGKKINATDVIKALFNFKKKYTKYYERIRSQISSLDDFDLGELKEEDFALNQVEINDRKEELNTKKDKKSKQTEEQYQLRLKLIREARKQKLQSLKTEESDLRQTEVEAQDIDDEELPSLEELETRRQKLEQKMEEKRLHEERMAEERRRLKEEQEKRKKQLEEQIKRRREQEKIEKQKRAEKLAIEKRKREEVRQRRIDSLKSAFETAKEKAKKKEEVKLANKAAQQAREKEKKKKKVNVGAVKMMIRFGDDNAAITKKTGLEEEQVELLRQEVAAEDGKA